MPGRKARCTSAQPPAQLVVERQPLEGAGEGARIAARGEQARFAVAHRPRGSRHVEGRNGQPAQHRLARRHRDVRQVARCGEDVARLQQQGDAVVGERAGENSPVAETEPPRERREPRSFGAVAGDDNARPSARLRVHPRDRLEE